MNNECDVEYESDHAKHVGVIGATFCAFKEYQHPVETEETVETNCDLSRPQARNEVEEVKRKERENIEGKALGLDVMEG